MKKIYIRADIFRNYLYELDEIKKESINPLLYVKKVRKGIPCTFIWNDHIYVGYAIKIGRKSKRLRVQFEHLGKFHELSLPKHRVWLYLDESIFDKYAIYSWATYTKSDNFNSINWRL